VCVNVCDIPCNGLLKGGFDFSVFYDCSHDSHKKKKLEYKIFNDLTLKIIYNA